MWIPCEPTEKGAVNITLQDLDAQGLASEVRNGLGNEGFWMFLIENVGFDFLDEIIAMSGEKLIQKNCI